MCTSLKNARETLSSIKWLQQRHEQLEKELIRLGGQTPYEQTKQFYGTVIAKLSEEMKSLPTGHRYTGTFYLKKPYIIPLEFEKIEGSAFMREDLVSWQIEPQDQGQQRYCGYCKAIYKQPDLNTEVKREDTAPVYDVYNGA